MSGLFHLQRDFYSLNQILDMDRVKDGLASSVQSTRSRFVIDELTMIVVETVP